MTTSPTTKQFQSYQAAFDYLNQELFEGKLPPCILNFSRHANCYGFFSPERWSDGRDVAHEISLNPDELTRPLLNVLATLTHEMCHLWKHEFGKKQVSPGYHCREWANKMLEVGLIPSDTAQLGGKQTGWRVSHYVDPQGKFAQAFARMPEAYLLPWKSGQRRFSELTTGADSEELTTQVEKSKRKRNSKMKHTCPQCQCNAWGKAALNLLCGECLVKMVAENAEPEVEALDAEWRSPLPTYPLNH